MEIDLIPATNKDFEQIAHLADQIWRKHYIPIIGEEQVNYMLSTIYNYESLVQQVEQKHHDFFMINSGNETIGFISISEETHGNYWIHKFYVLNDRQGKGIGAKVFEKLKSVMVDVRSIRLTVNRQNYKSINFYFKMGFTIDQVSDFDIGRGYYMNDFVMLWRQK